MLEVATTFFKEKKGLINAIQRILLSARSATRTTEILADDNKHNLIDTLQKSPAMQLHFMSYVILLILGR